MLVAGQVLPLRENSVSEQRTTAEVPWHRERVKIVTSIYYFTVAIAEEEGKTLVK